MSDHRGEEAMKNKTQNWVAIRGAVALGMGAMGIVMLSGCLLDELSGDPETSRSRRNPVSAGCALLDDQEPNDTSTQSTPLELGSVMAGCLDGDDEDHFAFRAPPVPASGGYVKLDFSNVDPDLWLRVFGYVASNNLELQKVIAANDGAHLTVYWAVDPNTDYRFSVQPYVGHPQGAIYAFEATWNPIVDPFEPNQDRETAAPIAVDTPVEGYFNAEARSGSVADWYSVELQSGPVRFDLTDPPSNVSSELSLFDSKGVRMLNEFTLTDGAELSVDRTLKEAGTYYVRVQPFSVPEGYRGGTDTTVPAHFVQPYTLTVSQP
jgi:hypothetical protein